MVEERQRNVLIECDDFVRDFVRELSKIPGWINEDRDTLVSVRDIRRMLSQLSAADNTTQFKTWIDWLYAMGLIYKPVGWDENDKSMVCVTTPMAREAIPANIAGRLPRVRKERR